MSETITESPSFAAVLKPELVDEGNDQLSLFWGRFWGEQENLAGAFYAKFNLDQPDILQFKPVLFETPDHVMEFDPDDLPEAFKDQIPDDPFGDSSIPQATNQMVNQTFGTIISDRENTKTFRNVLEEKNRHEFKEWAYNFFSNMINKGELTFQVKGQLVTRSTYEKLEEPKTSGQDEAEDEGAEQSENKDEDRNYRPISLVTSPMKGEFAGDILEGEKIYVRATGPIVEKLPDDFLDERHDGVSIPIEATILGKNPNPSLPSDFEGDPSDYWGIKVGFQSFLEGEYGEGFVHKDEQIKLSNPTMEKNSNTPWFFEPEFLIGAGLTIFAILGLAFFIFG